uniref:Putative secreted peptide n=1 Tax=Anopheles braziliensis TaxID=58242 RepID=A0A2M3ZNM3_9DIPT
MSVHLSFLLYFYVNLVDACPVATLCCFAFIYTRKHTHTYARTHTHTHINKHSLSIDHTLFPVLHLQHPFFVWTMRPKLFALLITTHYLNLSYH